MPNDASGRQVNTPPPVNQEPQRPTGSTGTDLPGFVDKLKTFSAALQRMAPAAAQGDPASSGMFMPERVGGAPPQMTSPLPQSVLGSGGVSGLPPASQSAGAPNAAPGPSKYPLPVPGGFRTGFEFNSQAGKKAAIISGAMQNIGESVQRFKQIAYDKKLNEAKGLALRYIAQKQAGGLLAGEADKMLMDEKVQKVFDKAMKDPTGPEYFGIQQAYADAMSQEAAKAKMTELMSGVAQAQAQAAKLKATTPQTAQERGVAMGTIPSADVATQVAGRLMEAEQKANAEGFKFMTHGLMPVIQDAQGNSWTGLDLKNPKRLEAMPPAVKNALMADIANTAANMDFQEKKQATAQAFAWDKMLRGIKEKDQAEAVKIYDPLVGAKERLAIMDDNAPRAKKGDQQAMVAVLSNHIGLTLGLQKGARITMTHWAEAEKASPILARLRARAGFDEAGNFTGFRSGTVLTPEQVDQMVHMGQTAYDEIWDSARIKSDIAGLETEKLLKNFPEPRKDKSDGNQKPTTNDPNRIPEVSVSPDGTVTVR